VASERAEVVESTVVAWAGTAAGTAAGAAATRIEAVSGQSTEGTGTAWVGASIGEARAAREARADAVALGSTAKEFAGTKRPYRGCCLQRKGCSGWGRHRPGPAAHDGDWARAGLRASQQQGGRSYRRWPRPSCPRGQAGDANTCHTRAGKWLAKLNRKRKQRAVLRSRSTALVRRLCQGHRCSRHRRIEWAEAAAVAAFAPTLPDAHQSHHHRIVLSSPWHSTAGKVVLSSPWHSTAGRRARARPMRSAGCGASDLQSARLDWNASATRKSPRRTTRA
jgi:hypothetical protein